MGHQKKLTNKEKKRSPIRCLKNKKCENESYKGEGGVASWEGGAVDGGSMNAFLAAALARVMRVAVPIPAVTSASVFHSATVGGSVVDVVRPL